MLFFWCKNSILRPTLLYPIKQGLIRDSESTCPRSDTHGFAVVGQVSLPLWRDSQRPLYRPASVNSSHNDVLGDAGFASPLTDTHSLPVVRKHSHPPAVVALFHLCRPSAVIGLIITVIVNAINAVVGRRLWSHVGQEVEERILPPLAHRNPTPSIKMVLGVSRVVAALPHGPPARVFRAFRLPLNTPVITTTRKNLTASEMTTADGGGVSALALTKPINLSFEVGKLNNSQFSIHISSFVFSMWGELLRIAHNHCKSPNNVSCGRGGYLLSPPNDFSVPHICHHVK